MAEEEKEVAITERVSQKVTCLSITRDKNNDKDVIKAEWRIPDRMVDSSRSDRAQWVDAWMWFDGTVNGVNRWKNFKGNPPEVWWVGPGSAYYGEGETIEWTGADCFWIKGLALNTSVEKPFDRKRYHPCTLNSIVERVSCCVQGGSTEERFRGDFQTNYIYFQVPKPPEITDITFDSTTHRGKVTITADKGTPERERYDTGYRVCRKDNISNTYKELTTIYPTKGTFEYFTDDSFETKHKVDGVWTDDINIPDAMSLNPGQWIEIQVRAYSRGLRGNSSASYSTKVYSCPPKGEIKSITAKDLSSSGQIRIKVDAKQDEHYPIDQVKLQELPNNSTAKTVAEANADNSWSDVSGASGNGTVDGFTIPVLDHTPVRGYKKWFRIASIHDTYTVYSDAVEAKDLFRDKTPKSSDTVKIDSLTSNEDANGLELVLGWKNDQSDYTEVYYSEYPDAMESNQKPSPIVVDWEDSSSQVTGFAHSAHLTIYGVEEGTDYYVWACRYKQATGEDPEVRGPLVTPVAAQFPYRPASKPTDVVLIAPDFVEKGKDFNVNWTYVAGSDQTAWNLMSINGNSKTLLLSGADSVGSTKVLSSLLPSNATSVTLSVSMTTGSEWTESEQKTVRFVTKPTLAMAVTSPMTQQGWPMSFSTSSANCSVLLKIYSKGISFEHPQGTIEQLPNDAVFSSYFNPTWSKATKNGITTYSASVQLPLDLPFYNLGNYRYVAVAIDNETGLVSDEVEATVQIRWWHEASAPMKTSIILEDQDDKSVRIKPIPPAGYNDTDRVDIYRVTPESVDLIAYGVIYGSVVRDRYAPYSKLDPLCYRLVHRTSDGDLSWRDHPYRLKGYAMRFDWGQGEYLEVPYNIKQSDKYDKDFELRKHMDGSLGGAWNQSITKTSSISTDIVRISDPEQQKKVRELGQYPGAVFVRTPNGLAYEANVTVGKMDWDYSKLIMGVSFNATRFDLTDEFVVHDTDILAPELGPDTYTVFESELLYWDMPGQTATVPAAGQTFDLEFEPAELTETLVRMSSSVDDFMTDVITGVTVDGNTITLSAFDTEVAAWVAETSAVENVRYKLTAEYRH